MKSLPLFMLALLATAARSATYEWTAGGDGVSFFQEANWTLEGGGGTIPLIDPNVGLQHDLRIAAGTPGGPGGFGAHLRTGGRTITISGGTTRGSLTAVAGIHNDGSSGGARAPLVFSGGNLLAAFLTDIAGNISGNATLTLYSGGNPLDNSTLALDPAWTGGIRFEAETPASVRSEHLAKLSIGGLPVEEGVDVSLTPLGSTGCLLARAVAGIPTLPVPPPLVDTDRDGLPDSAETATGTFVSAADTGSFPAQANSDGDRFRDGGEVLAGTDPNQATSQPSLPNVVLILADDLGWNHLGAYRKRSNQIHGTSYDLTLAPTPNIDSLAAQGVLFTDAYSGCTVCGPSRSSLLTGVHTGHIPFKVNSAYTEITPRLQTLGELFRRHGYASGYFGKWGLSGAGSGQTPNDRGYDHFLGMLDHGHGHVHYPSYLIENGRKLATGNTPRGSDGRTSLLAAQRVIHSHELFTQGAVEFIDAHKDEAFFCTFSPTLVHTELIATDPAVAPFLAKNWPEYNVGDNGAHYPQTKPRAHFAGMLKMLDDSVGVILQRLDQHGLAANTIVIFASDNGGQLQSVWGSAPSTWFDANGILRGGKQDSYEGGLRVPMLVRWPGQAPAGSVSQHPLYFADFMPTFCELLGTAPPSYTDGISFLPSLQGRGADQTIHPYLYWCHQGNTLDHAVRAGKWKAVKRGSNALELYDLDADIRETSNVASANPAIAAELQQVITREYMPDLNEPKPSAASPLYPNDP